MSPQDIVATLVGDDILIEWSAAPAEDSGGTAPNAPGSVTSSPDDSDILVSWTYALVESPPDPDPPPDPPPPEPPPPAVPPPSTIPMPDFAPIDEWADPSYVGYTIEFIDHHNTRIGVVNDSESISLEFNVNAPNLFQFSIDGESAEIASMLELATDAAVWRVSRDELGRPVGTLMYRGRVGFTQDAFSANRHTVTVNTADYREVLARRQFWVARAYNNLDQSAIAWDMINYTQNLPGGNLRISRGIGNSTGRLRTRDYEPGKSIGEALQQLGEVIDGFDWEISPELEFNLFYPERGVQKEYVFEYGTTVLDGNRSVSSQDFANAIRANGDDGDDPETQPAPVATAISANIETAPEGRWEKATHHEGVRRQTTIQDKADHDLQIHGAVRPTYSLVIEPETWNGRETFWLGDTCRVKIQRGRLDVDDYMRIYGITIGIGEDGDEEIRVALNAPEPRFDRRIRNMATTLSALTRR